MIFFSGFGFCQEKELFKEFLPNDSKYIVAGFSYGAIKALEYTLKVKKRVDLLLLLSPAFFNSMPTRIKELQIKAYLKDKKSYMKSFYNNATRSKNVLNFRCESSLDQLKELLFYEWKAKDLQKINDKGIRVELHLAKDDKIVDTDSVRDFFLPYGDIYLYKNRDHLLRVVNG